jgi:hypothetical protein
VAVLAVVENESAEATTKSPTSAILLSMGSPCGLVWGGLTEGGT